MAEEEGSMHQSVGRGGSQLELSNPTLQFVAAFDLK